MIVRELQRTDRAALSRLLARIEQFTEAEVAVALELADAALDDATSGYHVLVASGADELAGYICFGPTPMTDATWDLYWIAVAPTQQGRGIGRTLYEAFVERMRAQGGKQVRIETSSKESYANTGGFYERLGFAIAGELRDFYADGDHLLVFYRRIG